MLISRGLCLSLVLLVGGLALAQGGAVQQDDRVTQLIQQLGSNKYTVREKAQRELEQIGMLALEPLRKASKDTDLEISRRGQELLKKLEDKLAAKALLTPKMVNLSFKDTPIAKAIEELRKQSGYEISFQPGRAVAPTERTVTLETGEVTFWEAFDKLCQAGNLREVRTELDRTLLQIIQMQQQMVPPPVPLKLGPPGQNGAAQQAQQIQKAQQIQIMIAEQQAVQRALAAQRQQGLLGNQPGTILIIDGTPDKCWTLYEGDLRIRLLHADKNAAITGPPSQKREAHFLLEITAEPRVKEFSIVGAPRIDKALDEQGQKLAPLTDSAQIEEQKILEEIFGGFIWQSPGLARQFPLHLELGDKKANSLKELAGVFTIQARNPTPDALVTITDVMQSAGKTAKGQGGQSLELVKIEKNVNGGYAVQVRCQGPQQSIPGNNAVVGFNLNGGRVIQMRNIGANPIQRANVNGVIDMNPGSGLGLPALEDAKGMSLAVEQVSQMQTWVVNGQLTQEVMMVFRAGDGVGEPTRMVLYGHRMVTVTVPFRFEDVRLP